MSLQLFDERYHTQCPFACSEILLRHNADISCFRQALRYIIRNTTLPQRMRASAQLSLAQMHCYTRRTQIRNRCIQGGRGRAVFSDFRMARVSGDVPARSQYTATDEDVVPFQDSSTRGGFAWCAKSKLVDFACR